MSTAEAVAGLFIADDGHEPTVWLENGDYPIALAVEHEVDPILWRVLVAAIGAERVKTARETIADLAADRDLLRRVCARQDREAFDKSHEAYGHPKFTLRRVEAVTRLGLLLCDLAEEVER